MRDYDAVVSRIRSGLDRDAAMKHVADELWDAFSAEGVSWVGFYLKDQNSEQMVLGPRRDKPACSPIGLHGACGQAWLCKRALVVRDVRELGPNYIACDPRDQSEVVIPLLESRGACWGVLDVDSFAVEAFDDSDVDGLQRVLSAAGLSETT